MISLHERLVLASCHAVHGPDVLDALDRIAELQTKLANYESDAYVLSLLTKLDAVKECQRYTVDDVSYTTNNPDGEWVLAAEVLEAIGEQEEVIDA